jgi:choline dehydrogenase-like flavoprotein
MHDKVDVLIIGSGASGATVAWSLANTNMRIVCLEQGDCVSPNYDPSNRRIRDPTRTAILLLFPYAAAHPLTIRSTTLVLRSRSSTSIASTARPSCAWGSFLAASVGFQSTVLDGVADDWPIDYDTLEPFYAESDRMMRVSGLAGDPAYSPKQPPMPLLPLGKSGSHLAEAINRLDWHWWPSDATIASTDIAYWPHAIRAGVELRTACRVREITLTSMVWLPAWCITTGTARSISRAPK